MKELHFLCDECTHPALIHALWQREPEMDILRVGQPGTPPRGTLDPELLVFAEDEKRTLITMDKRTMPDHVRDHHAAGRHTWGVFILKQGYATQRYVEDLILVWSVLSLEDCRDLLLYLPF
jgi:hypothetical protein